MTKLRDVKYKLGRIVTGAALACLPLFGCEKDPVDTPSNPSNPTNPTQPTDTTHVTPIAHRNVELVYGRNSDDENQWKNISFDTLRKYSADSTVDTIFMVPESYDQYNAYTTPQLQYIIPKFRERRNVDTTKIRGRGELQLWNQATLNHPEIVAFFQDTMGYSVTYRATTSKSR